MRSSRIPFFARAGVALAALAFSAGVAAAQPLTVVELFTSQGCSSCPPANANLVKLSGRSDVLALSFAVTYWDYLGWKDSFGDPAYTQRQQTYEPALGQSGPFTPQMVVNGKADVVGQNFAQVNSLISREGKVKGPDVSIGQGTVKVGAGSEGSADVWLVRYRPGVVSVAVKRGENGGHTLPHANVVHSLKRIGHWNGAAAEFSAPKEGDGLKTAILVQAPNGGRIIAAATN